jgi:tRNA threonylcarbamoyladenosine biosynthesis protein TsaE
MLIEVLTHSEKETELVGEGLGRTLGPGSVVALFGGLGAGKTAFVRGLARAAGYKGRVTSPTYSIVNEYLGEVPVFHFDMYRLEGPDELYELGWEDYLLRGGICAVEWSERIEDAFPADTVRVIITAENENERRIRIEADQINADHSA